MVIMSKQEENPREKIAKRIHMHLEDVDSGMDVEESCLIQLHTLEVISYIPLPSNRLEKSRVMHMNGYELGL